MKILYVTNLSGYPESGLTYSVPAQIKAQSKYDDVYWVNTTEKKLDSWFDTGVFHSTEGQELNLDSLPIDFQTPDLVVFEDFYQFRDYRLSKILNQRHIPYVVVPRGALNANAQQIKSFKKFLGNLLIFSSFAKKAKAIQFLTEQEKVNSGDKWNKSSFIIPNGVDVKTKIKSYFNSNRKVFSFIGRVRLEHKGLDLLVIAVARIQDLLRKNNVVICIYGDSLYKNKQKLEEMIKANKVSDIFELRDSVYGKNKENVLLTSDIFVLTSRFEGLPMGLLEALSYGVPCLITTGTNMGKEVIEYDAGWVSETSVDGIVKSFKDCLNSFDTLKLKSDNALRLADIYSWDKLASKAHDVYWNLLN